MQKDVYFDSQAVQGEFNNQFNKFGLKLLNGAEMVDHLLCETEYSRIARYFLTRVGSISVELSGHQRPTL